MATEPTASRSLRLAAPDEALRVTWLELFFDLVFAAAIGALGQLLGSRPDAVGALAFGGLFLAVTWVWSEYTVLSSRFEADDMVHRLLTFGLIASTVVMVEQIPFVPATGGGVFAAGYLAARAFLFALHARPQWRLPSARGVHTVYFIATGLQLACWAASFAFAPPVRYVWWGVGLAINLVFPLFDRAALRRFPVNTSHLPERLGLFVLIVLGESLLATVTGLSHIGWGPVSLAAATLACALAACLWWAYFSFLELADHECTLGTGLPYLYGHMPILAGLTVVAVGIRRLVVEAAQPAPESMTIALLAGGLVVWLLAFLVVQMVAEQARLRLWLKVLYLGVALGVGAIALLAHPLGALGVLTGLVALMAGLVAAEANYCRFEIASILAHDSSTEALVRIAVDELARRLDAGEPVAVIDVRRHPDARQIPGSLRLDPDEVLGGAGIVLPYDRDRLIVTYCT